MTALPGGKHGKDLAQASSDQAGIEIFVTHVVDCRSSTVQLSFFAVQSSKTTIVNASERGEKAPPLIELRGVDILVDVGNCGQGMDGGAVMDLMVDT